MLLSAAAGPLANGLVAGGFLIAYVVLEWLSFIHEYRGLPVTPWNPGLGLLFGLIILAGPWGGAVLFAGIVVAEILVLDVSLSWPMVVVVAAIFTVGYTGVAMIARRRLRLDAGLRRLRDVLLLLLAGSLGALLVGLLLTGLRLMTGQFEPDDILQASLPLLVGDVIGISVMTPLMLRLMIVRPDDIRRLLLRCAPELLTYAVVSVAGVWAIVATGAAGGPKYFSLLFLPVVVAAVRHGLDGACIGLAATQFGLVALLHVYGYDAQAFTEFQTLMVALTAAGLTVGVVVNERWNADRRARDAQALLRQKEAEAAQAARFNLVSGMAAALAHEINQPMTAARALARSAQHLMKGQSADIDRAVANVSTMVLQIDHAAQVVKRMREFLGRGRPHASTVDVRRMLEDALALIAAEAEAKQVRIDLEVAADLSHLHADRVQLQQVLLNLVRNAIEALAGTGRTDGVVRVSAESRQGPARIEFAVADNGPGIEPVLANRLFMGVVTSKEEGLGLGLSISASIVEAHGGRIWLHSGEAGGTEFRFELPLETAKGK